MPDTTLSRRRPASSWRSARRHSRFPAAPSQARHTPLQGFPDRQTAPAPDSIGSQSAFSRGFSHSPAKADNGISSALSGRFSANAPPFPAVLLHPGTRRRRGKCPHRSRFLLICGTWPPSTACRACAPCRRAGRSWGLCTSSASSIPVSVSPGRCGRISHNSPAAFPRPYRRPTE